MLQIDGSKGEGGGQVLRSSLALSMATGMPFEIVNIRAKRSKPGLLRQHLTAVEAAAKLCGAKVSGAAVGSLSLSFSPGPARGGTHHFSIGTAGSTTLVLQAILPALLFAEEPSDLVIEGGTHALWAPPFEFLQKALIPLMSRLGSSVEVTLERHGFYPAGGGRVRVHVTPTRKPLALELLTRGEATVRHATILLSRLPGVIADRERARIIERLGWDEASISTLQVEGALSPGNVILLELGSENVTELVSSIGAQSKPALAVADEAIEEARAYLAAGVPVGTHMADQLMVPLALAAFRGAGPCGFRTSPLSMHARTNAEIVEMFLPGRSSTEPGEVTTWSVR